MSCSCSFKLIFTNFRLESYDRNDNFCDAPVILPTPVLVDWPTSGFRQLLPSHRTLLPMILEGHITGYFTYRVASDQDCYGDIAALSKGKLLVDANRVETCSLSEVENEFFVSGIVRAMMKKKVFINVFIVTFTIMAKMKQISLLQTVINKQFCFKGYMFENKFKIWVSHLCSHYIAAFLHI
jgi:hypothetical protein